MGNSYSFFVHKDAEYTRKAGHWALQRVQPVHDSIGSKGSKRDEKFSSPPEGQLWKQIRIRSASFFEHVEL
jgi:hypothetical protein